MIEKIPHSIGNYILPLKSGFDIGYGIVRKYRPIWVSVLDLNQNSGFNRTLDKGQLVCKMSIFVHSRGWGLNLVHVVVECPLVENFMVDKSVVEKLGVEALD